MTTTKRQSNYHAHALREFKAAGWDLEKDPMQKAMCEHILKLLDVFAEEGHSGSSSNYAIRLFTKLASFEPIAPLTGEDWEWNEVGNGAFQNSRCSHVFKQADRFNGQAYDIEGIIFRDANGSCCTNWESRVPVTFPYTPKRVYVNRYGMLWTLKSLWRRLVK